MFLGGATPFVFFLLFANLALRYAVNNVLLLRYSARVAGLTALVGVYGLRLGLAGVGQGLGIQAWVFTGVFGNY